MLSPEDFWAGVAAAAFVVCAALGSGCGVRSATVCTTYDRALSRPDPTTGLARDSAGASACVEVGPKE